MNRLICFLGILIAIVAAGCPTNSGGGDGGNNPNPKGGSWQTIGSAGISNGKATDISLAINSSGLLYVAYSDEGYNNKITVMKYENDIWTEVGGPNGFSDGDSGYCSIDFDSSDIPYVGYCDGGTAPQYKATVKSFTGGAWNNVGSAGFSDNQALYISFGINGSNIPYIVYSDKGTTPEFKATVMCYSGGTWTALGGAGISGNIAAYNGIDFDSSGNPYIVYQDRSTDPVGKATAQIYSSSSWSHVGGSAGFSSNIIGFPALDVYNDVPYVAFEDLSQAWRATVMKYESGYWQTVGTAGFSADQINYTSLVVYNGVPYVAFLDVGNSHKATVMKYENGSWQTVGTAGFSAGYAKYTSLAVHDGVPYVAFQDGANGNKLTVMKYNN